MAICSLMRRLAPDEDSGRTDCGRRDRALLPSNNARRLRQLGNASIRREIRAILHSRFSLIEYARPRRAGLGGVGLPVPVTRENASGVRAIPLAACASPASSSLRGLRLEKWWIFTPCDSTWEGFLDRRSLRSTSLGLVESHAAAAQDQASKDRRSAVRIGITPCSTRCKYKGAIAEPRD